MVNVASRSLNAGNVFLKHLDYVILNGIVRDYLSAEHRSSFRDCPELKKNKMQRKNSGIAFPAFRNLQNQNAMLSENSFGSRGALSSSSRSEDFPAPFIGRRTFMPLLFVFFSRMTSE